MLSTFAKNLLSSAHVVYVARLRTDGSRHFRLGYSHASRCYVRDKAERLAAWSKLAVLDLEGVTASACFVQGLIDEALHDHKYVMLANVNPITREELALWHQSKDGRSNPVWICGYDSGIAVPRHRYANFEILGSLSHMDRFMVRSLVEHGSCTASEISERFPGDLIGTTEWSNRLASLENIQLAVSEREGRQKRYQLLFPVKGEKPC